jgi:subfamily B ATP-binding cassette protein MsbA
MLYQPLKRLLRMPGRFSEMSGSTDRIFTFLDYEVEQSGDQYSLGSTEPLLKITNLTFRYQPDAEPALRDISMTIDTGQSVALVGYSGAGKSSLIKLIPYLYRPETGDISLAGLSLRDWNLKKLREQMSLVPQDSFFFCGTVRDNMLIAHPTASDAEIREAMKLAHVDFVRDLDDIVQERGNNYSGGQKQRLGLARAFLRDTPIIILDEPSSSLDSHSESLIKKSLHDLIGKKTIILVTHKFDLIREFDNIICFEEGRIVETGTHDELCQRGGYYHSLIHSADR